MKNSDFWSDYADAMEISVQGNRLIAREIADIARNLWQRAMRSLDATFHGLGQHRHLPPL